MNALGRVALWVAKRAGGLAAPGEITAALLDSWFATQDRLGPGMHGAMEIPAAYACVRVIAETIGALPIRLIESSTDEQGRTRRDHRRTHPMQRLVASPSEHWSGPVFFETWAGHLAGWGNCYAYIVRGNDGIPRELIPLLPGLTYQQTRTGSLDSVYMTSIADRPVALFPEDVLHVPLFGYNGREGLSPLSLHRRTLGIQDSQLEYLSRYLSQAANIRGVIEHPKRLGEDAIDKLRTQFAELYAGEKTAGKTAVLTDGMTFKDVKAISPTDAAYVDGYKLTARTIYQIFRIPPTMVGDLERGTYSNTEQQAIQFYTGALIPYLVKLEAELNRKLIRERDQGRLGFKFNPSSLLRGDTRTRYAAYRLGISTGWMTRNEAREKEDMNPLEGLDDPLVPLNMGGVDEDGEIVSFSDADEGQGGSGEGDGTGEQGGARMVPEFAGTRVLVRSRAERVAARMAPTHRYVDGALEELRP